MTEPRENPAITEDEETPVEEQPAPGDEEPEVGEEDATETTETPESGQ
jgi:hypothetical protein